MMALYKTETSTADASKSSLNESRDEIVSNSANRKDKAEEAFEAVFWLKLAVLTVLVGSAVAVALSIFFYTSNEEKNSFEESFLDSVTKVFESGARGVDLTLGIADSFAVGVVSFASHTDQEWPFVTIPDYGVRLSKIRDLANAAVVSTYPLVSEANRERWQNYSLANDDWVREGLEVQANDEHYSGKVLTEYEPYGIIHGNNGPSEGPGPFFPIWQSAPIVPIYAPYNWDGAEYDALATALPELLESKKVVISKVSNFAVSNDPQSIADTDVTIDWIKDYISEDDDPAEPMSDLFYPIVDNAADSARADSGNSTVVAILSVTFFWREFLEDILPPGTSCVVVFRNSCDQAFSYQLDGPDATYMGRGDLHDSKYDYLRQSELLDVAINSATFELTYSGFPLSMEGCRYVIDVYPSRETEDRFTTKNPATFTVAAVLIFAFTSAIFLIYDRCVERRQKKVMRTALQSTANVSLLEEKVKERTSKLQITNERLEEANRTILEASAAQLQHFACMSHEIRTPLNCIIGLSSLLQESELNPVQAESMQMIVTSSDLLLTVVNDVLDYSKLESGNVDIEIQRSSLQDTLNSVVHAIEAKSISKKLCFRTFYDARLCEYVNTDGRRLQQILYNLLGNAVKFSDDGGVVELSVSLCNPSHDRSGNFYSPSEKSAKAARQHNGDEQVLRFTVKDYGQGVAKKDFETIFQPFRQAGAETERVYGGTGLGLPITAKLVTGLGGSITIRSEEGKWTEFSVDFPFNERPADIEAISSGLKNATILFVCDQPEIKEQVNGTFRLYHTTFFSFGDMKELQAWTEAQGNTSQDRLYICVVHESLYDREVYKSLPDSTKLVIFGPKHSVEEAQGRYRSLVRVLPSVLMLGIGAHLVATNGVPQDSVLRRKSDRYANIVPCQEFRVLIAEDNAINQKVLFRILKRLGINKVEIVDNGQKAVDLEAAESFHVVLMDMQMPVMDGVEACQLICKRKGGHPKATVVFVTAHASEEFEAECLSAGASGFLPKPFNIRDIEKCFQSLHTRFGEAESMSTD